MTKLPVLIEPKTGDHYEIEQDWGPILAQTVVEPFVDNTPTPGWMKAAILNLPT